MLQGNSNAAYNTLSEFIILKDSVDQASLSERFIEYDIKYESLTKERQIAELELNRIKNKASNDRNRNIGIALLTGVLGIALFFFQSNRQKQKVNATLKEVDRLKSKFFSNISHELRTPLALIRGPIDILLKSDRIPSSEKPQLSMVARNTKRLTRLVNDLLELSRIETGTRVLKVIPVKGSDHLKTIFSNFESAFISKGQEYIYDVDEEDITAYYEPQTIETIVYNLISNAQKYSPSGATITAHASLKNQRLDITIHNTGQIIESDNLKRIFERFYRIEREGEPVEGAGVGLALVKELLNSHKGEINVTSTNEEGTVFHVSVPISKSAYKEEEYGTVKIVPGAPKSHPEVVYESDGQGINQDAPILLIVEDNADMQSFLKSAFSKSYQVRLAENGSEGLKIAKEIVPDIIISDMMMPILDGAAMCKAIKSDLALSHIPIIVLTAKEDHLTKLSTLELGVDDYISKPFSISEISIKVKNLLQIRLDLQKRYSSEDYVSKKELALSDSDQAFWKNIEEILTENLTDEHYTVEALAKGMMMSRMQLHRKLKALTGMSASNYLRNERLKKAKAMMARQKTRISDIAYECGFSNPFYFSKCFKDKYKISPKEYYKRIGQ